MTEQRACGNQAAGDRPLVAVAMSGGVDSSVTAALLAQAGHPVLGLTLRLFDGREGSPCRSLQAIEDARAVCDRLGLPHQVVDGRERFARAVVDGFVGSYLTGRTPNPCVDCNRAIKFGLLLERARELGARFLATGHYVELLPPLDPDRDPTPRLAAGRDPAKDQSYFLWRIRREALPYLCFPLGGYRKPEVRALAERFELPVRHRPESQEACFLEDRRLEEFIRERAQSGAEPHPTLRPGPILDREGRVIGAHRGSACYTVGQRQGLGLALGRPVYVIAVRGADNAVVVGEDQDLLADRLEVSGVNYLTTPPEGGFRAQVKVRYRSAPVGATIHPSATGEGALLELDQPRRAVTPGQSAVFYDGPVLLGGGVIGRAWRDSGRSA